MSTDLSTLDYIPPGHANAMTSFFVTVILVGLGGLWALIAMVLRIRSLRAAQARENAMHRQKPGPLSAGPERVIRGKVEVEGDNPVAVEVIITQTAENHTSKNSRSHSWKERSRAVVARPFKLVTEGGESIQVEPGDQVMVADGLETEHPPNRVMDRLRRCDVKRGEVFTVYGDLHGAPPGSPYRSSGAAGWTLKPYRTTGRMLLATETITERYMPRMQFLSVWSIILALAWSIFHVIITVPFCTSAFWGTHGTALVTGTSTYITTSKSTKTTHCVIEATTSEGTLISGEVVRPTYNTLVERRADAAASPQKFDARIPVITGPKGFPDYLGTEAHLNAMMLALCAIGWFAALLVVWSAYTEKAAWYDKAKFNEPGGSGHWPKK